MGFGIGLGIGLGLAMAQAQQQSLMQSSPSQSKQRGGILAVEDHNRGISRDSTSRKMK